MTHLARNCCFIILVLFCVVIDNSWADDKRGMFWQLERGKVRLSLLGSIHIGHPEMYPLPKEVLQAFNSAKALIVEVDTQEIDKQQLERMFTLLGTYPAGDNLRNHLSEQEWLQLQALLKKYSVPNTPFLRQKPWMAGLSLSIILMKQNGFEEQLGIDNYFISQAQNKKPIIQLESAEQQTQLMANFSEKLQRAMLRETIRQLDTADNYYRRMLNIWLRGDAAALDALISESFIDPEVKQMQTLLLSERNVTMAEKLQRLANGRYFVVLGAGHFVGADGIVALLKQQGFRELESKTN